MSKMRQRPGYTLLELLVSVMIFSGIIILAIAAFARSASSATKSNSVRNQVEAARSVIDQLTNDLHYVDTTDQVSSLFSGCGQGNPPSFIGVRLNSTVSCNEMELLLKYPGATGSGDLIWRLYSAATLNNRASIYVYEQRGCSVATGAISCPGTAGTPSDLLAANYLIDNVGSLNPVFTGLDILPAQTTLVSPYIKIHFDLKPATNANQTCAQLASGSCYTLDTTVIPGKS